MIRNLDTFGIVVFAQEGTLLNYTSSIPNVCFLLIISGTKAVKKVRFANKLFKGAN